MKTKEQSIELKRAREAKAERGKFYVDFKTWQKTDNIGYRFF